MSRESTFLVAEPQTQRPRSRGGPSVFEKEHGDPCGQSRANEAEGTGGKGRAL